MLHYVQYVCCVTASGEEVCGGGSGSSKGGSRKEYGPGSAAPSPSPGGGSHSSLHDDYDASPSSWPRPPSSPVSLVTRRSNDSPDISADGIDNTKAFHKRYVYCCLLISTSLNNCLVILFHTYRLQSSSDISVEFTLCIFSFLSSLGNLWFSTIQEIWAFSEPSFIHKAHQKPKSAVFFWSVDGDWLNVFFVFVTLMIILLLLSNCKEWMTLYSFTFKVNLIQSYVEIRDIRVEIFKFDWLRKQTISKFFINIFYTFHVLHLCGIHIDPHSPRVLITLKPWKVA